VYAEVGTLTGTELGNAGLVVGDDTAGVLLGAAVTLMGATLGPATTGFPVDTGTATGVGTL